MKAKIVVNGIGAIGKRVAHAVRLQDDMELVGISDVAPTSVLRSNLEPEGPLHGIDLYCSVPDLMKNLTDGGMLVKGTLPDLLKSGKVDLVVDATPAGIGSKNKSMYKKYGVKATFQGGEKPDITPVHFNSMATYKKCLGGKFVRVPSCNTQSLVRTLFTLDNSFNVKKVVASLARRAVDPWNPKKGPVNAIVPVMHVPSHHGPDVKTVLPNLNIKTLAVKVPTTLAHVHMIHAEVEKTPSIEEIREMFGKTPRITVLKASDGYSSTAEVMERYRDFGRPRYDMPEVIIWEETINSDKNDVFWIHAVHSEAICIPENIDAIRAMCKLEKDNWRSIEKTNKSLGIK